MRGGWRTSAEQLHVLLAVSTTTEIVLLCFDSSPSKLSRQNLHLPYGVGRICIPSPHRTSGGWLSALVAPYCGFNNHKAPQLPKLLASLYDTTDHCGALTAAPGTHGRSELHRSPDMPRRLAVNPRPFPPRQFFADNS